MVALLLGTTVTSCKGKSKADKVNDSIAVMMGKMEGTDFKAGLQQNPDMAMQIDKDQVLRGMMTVINMDTTKSSQSYIYGLKQGMRIYQELSQLEMQGINVDRRLYMNELKKVLESKDTINFDKMQKEMGELQNKLAALKDKSLKIRGEENLEAGKKYVDELLKGNDGYKKANSGAIYKIVEQGKGESFNETSVVDAKLLMKDINGNVLQNMSKPQPLPLAQIKQDPVFGKLYDIIKGMKPGAKATIVIPGDQIPEGMGLAPNMTYIFEITTVGLHPEPPRPAHTQAQNPSGDNAGQQPQPAPKPAAKQPAPTPAKK